MSIEKTLKFCKKLIKDGLKGMLVKILRINLKK